MNRRLYFVLPDVETSRKVENDLLLARIDEQHMHFLGKRGTELMDLPEATSEQKTDLYHGITVGLFSGALTGAFIGIIIYLLQDFIGMQIQMGIILLFFLLGGVFGVWISGFLIGSSTPNVKLKEFQHSMDEGHILLMIDAPKERVDEVREIVLQHHPEAEDHGIEPIKPVFP
jgi:hypothetical protein